MDYSWPGLEIYPESLEKLCKLYWFSKKVTMIDGVKPAATSRTKISEKIIEKILLHNRSIIHLLSLATQHIQEVDISLIASATRNIMESTNMYFHISERGISSDERKLRIDTMFRNEVYNSIDISQKLRFSQVCLHSLWNYSYLDHSKQDFKANPQFSQLTLNEQAQILSGRKASFQKRSPGIFDPDVESAIYNLFSNSVHGYHLGLANNSFNTSPAFLNFFTAERLLIFCLLVSRIYTAHAVKDYLDLRKRLYSLLDSEEKQLLKDYMSCEDFEDYINVMKTEFERDPFSELLESVEKRKASEKDELHSSNT